MRAPPPADHEKPVEATTPHRRRCRNRSPYRWAKGFAVAFFLDFFLDVVFRPITLNDE
jgi:hypothetical protein